MASEIYKSSVERCKVKNRRGDVSTKRWEALTFSDFGSSRVAGKVMNFVESQRIGCASGLDYFGSLVRICTMYGLFTSIVEFTLPIPAIHGETQHVRFDFR